MSYDAPDLLLHTGDLVGYAPWPNEVVQLLADAGIAGVSGNYDSTVAADYKHCGCRYEDPQQEALSHVSFAWTKQRVSAVTRRSLGALPLLLRFRAGGAHSDGRDLFLFHGTPVNNTTYWHSERSDDFARRMIAMLNARPGDVLAFGHTHVPWTRTLDGVTLINAGSIGRPKDADPRACYALLEMTRERVAVEFRRVEYPVETAANGIIAAGLPGEFADFLRSGGGRRP